MPEAHVDFPLITQPKTAWQGKWVWPTAELPQRNAYAWFRREFNSTAGTMVVAVTADSFYWLYLDGEQLAHGPSRSHLEAYSFDSHTVEISAGRHCLAIMGHHIGEENACIMTGRAGVLADVVLTEGEQSRDLSTGPDWQCRMATGWRRDLPSTMSHFGFWEDCDLRKLPKGWSEPGFTAEGWKSPVVVGIPPCDPSGRACVRGIFPCRVTNGLDLPTGSRPGPGTPARKTTPPPRQLRPGSATASRSTSPCPSTRQ